MMRKRKLVSLLLCVCLLLTMVSPFTGNAASGKTDVSNSVISGWGAHNYVAGDGETYVTTTLTAQADGGIQLSGNQVMAGLGIGVTNTAPIYLDEKGFSIEFSLDQWDTTSGDKWFALALMDTAAVTNKENQDPVYKGWDTYQDVDPKEGRGLVLIMRPEENGRIRLWPTYYGVASNSDATAAANGYIDVGPGYYDDITLSSGDFKNIKIELVKVEGGYNIVFNEGGFKRTNGDLLDTTGAINPHIKLSLLDSIFSAGTPAYVKMVAYNGAGNTETAMTIHKFNGAFANKENTIESWGVHNYTTPEGSKLTNTIEGTDTGDLVVKGNQTSGNGELGVTYARPIDMANGFSVEFSLDEYQTNGVNGADSWIDLQIKDALTVTNEQNTAPVYHKMDIGGGNPDAGGAGFHIMMRPGANHVLNIGEMYWVGLDWSTGEPVRKTIWKYDGDGCFASIQLKDYQNIKIEFLPDGAGGYLIKFDDNQFIPVNNPNTSPDGRINLANGFQKLGQYFDFDSPAYIALTYHDNVGKEAQFTVHSVNGMQAMPNTESSWGAHHFMAQDGSEVISNTTADADGGLVVSGNQTAGWGAIGATWKRPVNMLDGISVEFSLDEYTAHGGNIDTWIALQILDQEKVSIDGNTDGAYRHMEAGDARYGSGLVILIRPKANNQIQIAEIQLNGVKINGTTVTKENNWENITAGGCYSDIQLPSFQNIKVDIVPSGSGGFDIIFNDGDYIRVGADRLTNDHGRINVNTGFSNLYTLFSEWKPMYVKLAYKCNAGVPAQFTIHKVNGIAAVPAKEEEPIEVKDGIYQLFNDTKFENGFKVNNMGGSEKNDPTVGYFNYGNPSLTPKWTLAQWETKYDFRDLENDTMFMETDDGVYKYDSLDKILTVDTNTGELGLQLNASKVYDAPRKEGEGWPHLLIEQGTKNAQAPFASQLKNANHLRLQFSQKLTKFEDHMGDAATGLHAGSFYIYLYVKGINEKGMMEMTWFGLPLFDNRYAFLSESGMVDGGKADASGLFIYLIPSRGFTDTDFVENGKIVASEEGAWMNIDIDVLPYIKRALTLAQEKGFMKGVTMDTVVVDGMNMGWEMPGTYDGEMKIKNLSLTSYVGTTYESNNGIYNLLVRDMDEKETVTVDENLTVTVPKNLLEIDGIDESMLILQASKRDTTDGVTVEGRNVAAVYDLATYVNGNAYETGYDHDLELVYKAASGNISDLKFYTVGRNGKANMIEGTYDAESNTFRFSLKNASAIAVTTEQGASGTPGNEEHNDPSNITNDPKTGDSTNVTPYLCLMLLAACLIGLAVVVKRRYTDVRFMKKR